MPNQLTGFRIMRSSIDAMMPNFSYARTLTEGDIGIDTVTSQKIRPVTLTEGAIGIDTILRATVKVLTEGAIGVDSVLRAMSRALTEGSIGIDTIASVAVHTATLTENLIGVDTIRKTLNGLTVIWTHVAKAAAATFTKISKSTSNWTHYNQS